MDNELLCAKDRGAGGQTPFGPKEAETMSQTLSPSFARCYGLARVARAWRAGVYRSLKETPPNPSALQQLQTVIFPQGDGRRRRRVAHPSF